MSKFNRVAQSVPPTPGTKPTDLNGQQQAAPAQSPAPAQVQKPVVVNYFAQAGINPQQYTGTADQNERLRRLIDPQSRTFYDAYVKKFGKWAQHPSERIKNLNGGSAPVQAPAQAPGSTQGAQNSQEYGTQPNMQQKGESLPPVPPGFSRSQNGILIPPLPR